MFAYRPEGAGRMMREGQTLFAEEPREGSVTFYVDNLEFRTSEAEFQAAAIPNGA